MDTIFIDAPGGPQPEALAELMMPFRPLRIISVPWGSDKMRKTRVSVLRQLGAVQLVERPDQVVEAGLASAALHCVGAVVFLSEIVSFYAGLLAHLLALPGNSPQSLLATRNKEVQRRLLAQAGVPSPVSRTVSSAYDLQDLPVSWFPVILKPSTGVGSLCVFRADDLATLECAYSQALRRYRVDPRPNGAAPVFLVEREIAGSRWHDDERFGLQVSVESLLYRGVVHHLGVTDKLPLASSFREVGHITPSQLSGEQVSQVQRVAEDAIRALGLTTGAVHTELMLTTDGPVVLEVNGRLGGGVYELMRFSRGYDVVRAIVDVARDVKPTLPGEATQLAAFVKPQPGPGVFSVSAINRLAVQRALELADWGVMDKVQSAVVDSENGTNGNLARFVVTAPTADSLFERIEAVDSHIRSAVTLEKIG